MTVLGTYTPLTGDFDDDGRDDVLWYGPGSGLDVFWYDFDGRDGDDVFWYAPGTTTGDATWYMHATQGSHSTVLRTVNGASYLPAVDDFDSNAADDIIWFSPSGALGDPLWWSTVGATSASPDTVH